MPTETLENIIAQLTPERLRALIFELADKQPAGARETVGVWAIMQALAASAGLEGALPMDRYLRAQQAIEKTVGQLAGIKYVEVT
jgi:hypothetical protein